MTGVVVAASSPVVRSGLRSMIEELPDFAFAGSATSASLVSQAAELEPGAILWQLSVDEDAASILHALAHTPVLVLAQNPSIDIVRAGAKGVLAVDATADQIGVGLRAATIDLIVLAPEAIHGNHASAAGSALTVRETEVLRMIAEGLANKEIAYRLGISEHTVKFHVSALLGKLGAASRAEAIAIGIRRGAVLL